MTTDGIELVELEPQETAVVHARVRALDLPAFLGAAYADVAQALEGQHLRPVGPPFGRYVPGPEGFDVEAGFPAATQVTPSGRVVPLRLPGGTAARVRYQGDYAGIAEAYDAAHAWLASNGLDAAGQAWECYLDGPDVPEPRTEIYLPCRPR